MVTSEQTSGVDSHSPSLFLTVTYYYSVCMMDVYVIAHVPACMCGGQRTTLFGSRHGTQATWLVWQVRSHLTSSPVWFLRHSLSLNLELADSARLAGQ